MAWVVLRHSFQEFTPELQKSWTGFWTTVMLEIAKTEIPMLDSCSKINPQLGKRQNPESKLNYHILRAVKINQIFFLLFISSDKQHTIIILPKATHGIFLFLLLKPQTEGTKYNM